MVKIPHTKVAQELQSYDWQETTAVAIVLNKKQHKNIFHEGELIRNSVVANFATTAA